MFLTIYILHQVNAAQKIQFLTLVYFNIKILMETLLFKLLMEVNNYNKEIYKVENYILCY